MRKTRGPGDIFESLMVLAIMNSCFVRLGDLNSCRKHLPTSCSVIGAGAAKSRPIGRRNVMDHVSARVYKFLTSYSRHHNFAHYSLLLFPGLPRSLNSKFLSTKYNRNETYHHFQYHVFEMRVPVVPDYKMMTSWGLCHDEMDSIINGGITRDIPRLAKLKSLALHTF